jgi:hypothetical protein
MVLTEGITASACGRVVSADDATWFEPPLPVARPLFAPGHEPAPKPSGLGIGVESVDLNRLDRRQSTDGAVEGWACLSGTFRDGTLVVADQWCGGEGARRSTPQWSVPPCDSPPGGWPVGEADTNLEIAEDLVGAEVVAVTMFRPSSRQIVAVMASDDPALTRRRLGGALGDRLCVVQSKWSGDQVRNVRGALDTNHDAWLLYSCGATASADGQRQLTVKVVHVTSGFAEFAATVPEGLLIVEPWLTPAKPRA